MENLFSAGIHFNSHFRLYQVICVFSQEGQALGLTWKKLSNSFEDFRAMFSANEWSAIHRADEMSSDILLVFGTRKESYIDRKRIGHLP